MTREEYLNQAIKELDALVFGPTSNHVPEDVRVTCGWPSKGGLSSKQKTVGQCWSRAASEDGVNEIFISPTQADTIEVLGVLAHELIHAIDDCENGHKAPFRRIALAIGLTGKMTATEIGDDLRPKLVKIHKKLGNYPHAPMSAPPPKQKNRQLKLVCQDCGAIWRMARSWLILVTGCPCCQSSKIEGV